MIVSEFFVCSQDANKVVEAESAPTEVKMLIVCVLDGAVRPCVFTWVRFLRRRRQMWHLRDKLISKQQ